MTTVACDGKTMAGDGQAEAQGTIVSTDRQKVFRLADGSLFGCAGRTIDGMAVLKWLNEGGARPKVDKTWTALMLGRDGTLHYFTSDLVPAGIDVPAATGSGMDFAIGAMLAGATAERAVEIAAQRDIGTGGKVTVLALEQ